MLNEWIVVETKGTMQSPSGKDDKVKGLWAYTIHNDQQFLFNVLALEKKSHLVRGAFNAMAGTLMLTP